jgi:hypothetical protein
MATEQGVDRQAQLIRLILVILGAALALIGWARWATGPVRVPHGSTRGIVMACDRPLTGQDGWSSRPRFEIVPA